MLDNAQKIVNLAEESATCAAYQNHVVAYVNDHVVRLSVMTQPYHWHRHPDSDESFLVLEGGLLIELDGRTVELEPGSMFTVPQGVHHRTRPLLQRSVNLTFERVDALTEPVEAPRAAQSIPGPESSA